MKSIHLQKMSLLNFKGIKSLEVNFQNHATDIFGDNGTGKTTIFDAFTWLLFGKDSTDRKDFELKTLSVEGKPIEKIEHEVSAIIVVDGETIAIRRILKENWVKKKGSLDAEFSGNVTSFYWNEVPVNQTEYNQKVNSVLNEQIFKMITNPLAFVSLKWQERRNVLMQMAGTISDLELASGNSEYEALVEQLTQGKTLEDYKKQVAASIKKAKEDIKAIPSRIDEVERSKPEALDFVALKANLTTLNDEFNLLDNQIQNKSAAFDDKLKVINNKRLEANNLRSSIQAIEHNAKIEAVGLLKPDTSVVDEYQLQLSQKEGELTSANATLNSLESKKSGLKTYLEDILQGMDNKRAEWNAVNAETLNFGDKDFCCPTCKRNFEASDVESKKAEMLENFNINKTTRLSSINQQGQYLNNDKGNVEKEIEAIDVRIESGKTLISGLKTEISNLKEKIEFESSNTNTTEDKPIDTLITEILVVNQEYADLKKQLEILEASIEEVPVVDVEDLNERKRAIASEIYSINANLRNEQLIESANSRISELNAEQRNLAQQIANVEKVQFIIDNFNKLKIDTLEQRINQKFKLVKFKMFDTQINGGEVECCEPLINGVPFSDANTASKINAGIDIINTLCQFYEVTAPVFLDNRESVVKLIDTQSQLVNLIVSEPDKKLRVA